MARPTDDPKTARLDLRMPPDLLERIDEWRRFEPDIPARAEAIRRLIELGLFYGPLKQNLSSIGDIVDGMYVEGRLTENEIALLQKLGAQYGEILGMAAIRAGNISDPKARK